MAGRPKGIYGSALLTPKITKAICDLLEIAVPEKYAAEANGIAEETFRAWNRKGAAGIDAYAKFHDAVTRARAKCVANMAVTALKGAKGSSAAMWMLERRYYKEFGQRQRIEFEQSDRLGTANEGELDEEIDAQRRRIAEFERIKVARALNK